jgi:Tol biopolymer transport system component
MSIAVGDRIGRFEIVGALGSGGMGDVYRARDPQLRREVAIKVLPPEWAGDPARQRRLELEARAAAALNHPNIVAVHDFGVHEGHPYIVTELLQGETLRSVIRDRVLPPHKAVRHAIQIASGLAAGHDRGIVHRDIKPENVFVTSDGVLKILDFGLAALIEPGSSAAGTATVTVDGVELGRVAGTAIYMSPEQARGLRIDHRSDIFSLGSVLYEMLSGAAPFRRDTVADTLSAVLNDEPRRLATIADASPPLERLVQHCLEKKPEERFQNARDLIFALQGLPLDSATAVAGPGEPRRALRTSAVALAAIGALAAAAAIGYTVAARVATTAPIISGLNVRRLTEIPGLEEFPSISPDGRAVAFTGAVNGTRQVFVRLLAGGAPLAITRDAADHVEPRWTPDGNTLVYFSRGAAGDSEGVIWAIPALGGSPRRILSSISGADVSRNGRLTCFQLAGGRIQLVNAALDGTDARVVFSASARYHRYPRWSPDGRWIAFQRGDGVRDDVFVAAASGGEPRQLTNDRTVSGGLSWLPSSAGIVYASGRGNTVPYLPLLRLWEVGLEGGAARPITAADASYEHPDVHPSGLVLAARQRMRFDIWRFPVDGKPADNVRQAHQVTRQTGQVLTPTLSPDGSEIAFLADHGGFANLWVLSTSKEELRQITFERDPTAAVGAPIWSPDGRAIAFVSSKGNRGNEFGVWVVNPDGGNLRNVVRVGLGFAWSPDGKWIYYSETSGGALKKIPISGGAPAIVRPGPTRNVIGVHDGTLYYMVERRLVDGRPEHEVYAAAPENGRPRLVGRIPASRVAPWQIVNPALSPDGQWLAIPLTDGFVTNIWALSTRTAEWRQITDFGDRATFIARRVSWSPDGKSILAAVGEGDADVAVLTPGG